MCYKDVVTDHDVTAVTVCHCCYQLPLLLPHYIFILTVNCFNYEHDD